MKRNLVIYRGNIVYVDFGTYNNRSKQGGIRPACIVSNNKCNEHSPVVTVVPITSKSKKKGLPTHIDINKKDAIGLKYDSVALAEQIVSVDKSDIKEVVGLITSESVLQNISTGILIQCGINKVVNRSGGEICGKNYN